MSYEFYKLMHLVSILVFFSGLSYFLSTGKSAKVSRIVLGLMGLLILVGGMGLMARVGITHGLGWPLWLKAKMTLWLVILMVGSILLKRGGKFRTIGHHVCLGLGILAIFLAVLQEALV